MFLLGRFSERRQGHATGTPGWGVVTFPMWGAGGRGDMARSERLTPRAPYVAGAVTVFAAAIVLSSGEGHSYLTDRVSEMAAYGNPSAIVMTGGFLALAAAGVLSARATRVESRAIALFTALGATGVVGLALARCHAGCPSSGAPTFGATDAAHGVFAALTVVGWVIAPALAALDKRGSRVYRSASAAAAVSTPALLGLAPLTRFDGFVQLVIFAVMSAWLVAAAVEADRRSVVPPKLHALSVGAGHSSG